MKKFSEVKIFNQLTETARLKNLQKIQKLTNCKIMHHKNLE